MKETAKHHLIMTAAADLFARQGYRKTTIDEIVASAGISKGLFYHYFKNKKELYFFLYNTYVNIMSSTIRERVDIGEPDFFLRLRQITHIRIDFVATHPGLFKFLYSAYNETHPDIAPFIKDSNQKLLKASYSGSAANIDWTKLKKGLSPEKAIEIITWIAEGFVQKIAADKNPDSTEAYFSFDEYLEVLKSGMYEKKGE